MHGVTMQLWYVQVTLITYLHCAIHVKLVKDKTKKQMDSGKVTSQVHFDAAQALCSFIVGPTFRLQAKYGEVAQDSDCLHLLCMLLQHHIQTQST